MTGPEHYQAAEELLDLAGNDDLGSEIERYRIAKAQVHATLAQAAATAELFALAGPLTGAMADAWTEVLR